MVLFRRMIIWATKGHKWRAILPIIGLMSYCRLKRSMMSLLGSKRVKKLRRYSKSLKLKTWFTVTNKMMIRLINRVKANLNLKKIETSHNSSNLISKNKSQ